MIYNDITELPLKIFDKISNTGELAYLIETKPKELTIEQEQLVREAWDDIQRQLFDEFGMSDVTQLSMKYQLKYIEAMKDYYLNGNRRAKNIAKIAEAELAGLTGESSGSGSLLKTVVYASKAIEMPLQYNSLTVAEFFHYMKLADEIAKSRSKLSNKK